MEFVSVNNQKLRTSIGRLCLGFTRIPEPANPNGKVKSAFEGFCSNVCGIFESKKKPQAFGVIKSPLESAMAKLYTALSDLIPTGKPANVEAEGVLMRSGWTQEKILEVRALELQYKPRL